MSEILHVTGVALVEARRQQDQAFLKETVRTLQEAGHLFEIPQEYHRKFPERSEFPNPRGLIFKEDGEFADMVTPDAKVVTVKKGWGIDGWGFAGVGTNTFWNPDMIARESNRIFPLIEQAKTEALANLKAISS